MTITTETPDHAGAAHDAAHDAAYRLGKRHGVAAWRDGYREDIAAACEFYERKEALTLYERGLYDAIKAKTETSK